MVTYKQNSVVERKNHHIFEAARVLLFQIYLLKSYWSKAVLTDVYIINRVQSYIIHNISLVQIYDLTFPSTSMLYGLGPHVSGCVVFLSM